MLPSLPQDGGPARREDLEKVLRLVQKKDHHNVFKEPVTEDVVRPVCACVCEAAVGCTVGGGAVWAGHRGRG